MIALLVYCGIQLGQSHRFRAREIAISRDRISPVLDFADPEKAMPEKLRAMKSPDYKRLWPSKCTGENILGDLVFDSRVDGFKCLQSFDDHVAKPIAPTWYSQSIRDGSICCKAKCEEARYSDCSVLDLSGAALNIVDSVDRIIVGDKSLEVVHNKNLTDNDRAAGVFQKFALHIPETVVSFVKEKAVLTPEGEEHFRDIVGQIGALLSMLQTANRGSALLVCPHGSSTACLRESDGRGRRCEPIGKRLSGLPHQRAALLASKLEENIKGIKVGQSFGHYKYERKSDFLGGRFGAVIVKAYNSSVVSPPSCNLADLYNFVDMGDASSKEPEESEDSEKKGAPDAVPFSDSEAPQEPLVPATTRSSEESTTPAAQSNETAEPEAPSLGDRHILDQKSFPDSEEPQEPPLPATTRSSEESTTLAAQSNETEEPQASFREGATVVLQGLQSRPDLNGAHGTLTSFNMESMRWIVDVEGGIGLKAIKPSNLALVEEHTVTKKAVEDREATEELTPKNSLPAVVASSPVASGQALTSGVSSDPANAEIPAIDYSKWQIVPYKR